MYKKLGRAILALCTVIVLLPGLVLPQVSAVSANGGATIDFDCQIDASCNDNPLNGPWMFDLDADPYNHNANDIGYYAYLKLVWNPAGVGNGTCGSGGSGKASSGICTAENTNVQEGIADVTVEFDNFTLGAIQKRNWNVPGQSGDHRIYTGGVGTIKVDGQPKLKMTNSRITMDVDWPVWNPALGPGDNVIGSGWGTIDIANSNGEWVDEFNNGNGQVEFVFTSFSAVVQECWGAYETQVTVRGAAHQENMEAVHVINPGQFQLPLARLALNVTSRQNGGILGDQDMVFANQIWVDPGGTLPQGIAKIITDCYWEVGTVLDSITTDITFDLTDIPGITDPNLLSILKREDASHAWEIYPDQTLTDDTHIRANGVTSFSEWGLGEAAPTPVHNMDTGESFFTIQEAIDAPNTQNGNTIKVDPGTYTENVNVTKQVITESMSGDPTDTTIVAANANDHVFEVPAGYDNVTIKGFTIYGATDVGKAGIYVGSSADNCTISNNRTGYDAGHKNDIGIYIFSAQGNTVNGNISQFNTHDGIYVMSSGSRNNTISTNSFLSNGAYGIHLYTATENTVSGNTCDSNAFSGIFLEEGANNNNVTGNTSSNNIERGVYIKGFTSVFNNIYGNTFASNNKGVYIEDSEGNAISGNTITSNVVGIQFVSSGSKNNIITGNTITGNSMAGIYPFSANNIIYFNDLNQSTNVISASSLKNTWSSRTEIHYKYGASSFKSYLGSYYSDYAGADANSNGLGDVAYTTNSNTYPPDEDLYPLKETPASYTTNVWYLGNPRMYKNDLSKAPKELAINAGSSLVWADAQAAGSSGTYEANTPFIMQVAFTSAPNSGDNFTVDVGYSTNGTNFTSGGTTGTISGLGDWVTKTFTVTVNSGFTIPANAFLAVKITNNANTPYTVQTGGAWSYITMPPPQVTLPAYAGPAWYVSPDGDDTTGDGSETKPFRTIGKAVTQASNEHTIKAMDADDLYTDDYVENITVDKSLTIERYNDTGENPQVKAADANSHVFNVTASDVTIMGLDIYGATGADMAGIYLASGTSGCTIDNTRCGYSTAHWDQGSYIDSSVNNYYGIYLNSSNNNTVSANSTLFNYDGIHLNSSSNNLIRSNGCQNNTHFGLAVGFTSNGNFIWSNGNHSNGLDGIHVSQSNYNTVSGNTCGGNGGTGILLSDSDYNNISGNSGGGCARGIGLFEHSDFNTIAHNDLPGNDYNLTLSSSSNNIIYLNMLEDTGDDTIANVQSTDSTNIWQSPVKLAYKFNSQTFKSFMGNYFSDYGGADANGDGIGDTEYATGGGVGDFFPLMDRVGSAYELQTWYLKNPTMYKDAMCEQGGMVALPTLGSVIWESDMSSAGDMAFPAGMMADSTSWTGQVVFETAPATGDNFTVEVGYTTDGTDFTSGGALAALNGDGTKTAFTYTTNSAAVTVPSGKYLALKITNNSTTEYKVRTGGTWSYISAPVEEAPPTVEIAFVTSRDSDIEIYTMEINGDNQTRRTESAGMDNHPALSPDGNKIAFMSTRNGNRDIYVMNKDGSGLTQLTTDPAQDIWPAWSPNGNEIVFASGRNGALDIYKMDSADGANQTPLTSDPAHDLMPAWSPDGNKIAFVSYRDGDSEIFVMDTDGQNQTKLTDNTKSDMWPAWSPDSTKIVFNSDRDGNLDVYIMDASTGFNQTPLTSDPASDYEPYYLPDGSKIIFTSTRSGNPDVYSMDTDGNNQAPLTTSTQGDWSRGYWVPPVVTTQDASNRGTDGARLNANMSSLGSSGKIAASFQWGTSPGVYNKETPMQTLTALGTFYADIISLNPDTPYYFRVKTFGDGYAFGLEKTFNTLAGAATRHVGSGQAYATIQAAVDASSDGDTIIVHDGTYTENVNVNKQVVIQSQNGPSTTKVEAAIDSDHVFDVTVNNVTIRGFKIYGTGVTSEAAGIMLNQVTGCLIDNNYCGVDSSRDNDYGILLHQSSNNQVTGNHCIDDNEGITLQGSDNNTIKDNTIQYSESFDIHLEDSPFQNGSDSNIILHNSCLEGGGIGIYVDSSDSNEIKGNTVSTKVEANGIELYDSQNNTITRNTMNLVVGLFSAGIKLGSAGYPSNGNTIYLNNFTNNDTNVVSEGSTNVWHSPDQMTYDYTGGSVHTGYLGNYYDDYPGDDDGSGGRVANDGVGDTDIPVATDGDDDSYPLMATSNNYTGVTAHNLTTAVEPAGSGTTEPEVGVHAYAEDTEVDITATAAEGYRFVNWTGPVTDSNSPSTTVIMDTDKTVTAHFEATTILPGDATGDGNFDALDITKIERIIAGLDAGTPGADANQDSKYNALDITKIERLIVGLDGGAQNNPPVADAGDVINFYWGMSNTLNGSASYDPDTSDSIVKYEWDLNNDGNYEFTSISAATIVSWAQLQTYNFQKADPYTNAPQYTVNLRVTDIMSLSSTDTAYLRLWEVYYSNSINIIITGSGTVDISPEQDWYAENTQVTLTAIAADGYSFTGWGGDLSGQPNPYTGYVYTVADRYITATFTQN